MVIPLAVLIPVAASAGTALFTGIVTYFAFKPRENTEPAVNSKGEIYNNVQLAVEENNNQNNSLVLMVGILVLLKIIEVTIYAINSYKKSLKKKYNMQFTHNALVSNQPTTNNPATQNQRAQQVSTA